MNLLVLMVVSAAPWLQNVSAKDGVLPVQVVDSADFACNLHPRFHVELLDPETGEKKTEVPGWSELLGEFPDGALVVTNQSVPKAKVLKVGVLERSGALRFSCEVPFNVHPYSFKWLQSERGLEAWASKVVQQTGVYREPEPDSLVEHLFSLTFTESSCELKILKKPFPGKLTAIPGPKATGLALTTRVNGGFIDTVLMREKKVVWRRHTQFLINDCKVPAAPPPH